MAPYYIMMRLPGDPRLLTHYALTQESLGDAAKARELYEAALTAAPGFPEAMAGLERMGVAVAAPAEAVYSTKGPAFTL